MPKRSKGAAAKYAALSQSSRKNKRGRRPAHPLVLAQSPTENAPARLDRQPPAQPVARTSIGAGRLRSHQVAAQLTAISHDYVLTELKRIGILAVGIIALLLVLSFVVH